MSSTPKFTRTDTGDGGLFVVAGSADQLQAHVEQKLETQTETPTPGGDGGADEGGGLIRRFNDAFSALSSANLEAIGLGSHETADAIRTRRDELYRNEFPLLKPRFGAMCEACDAEFDEQPDAECPTCGEDALRPPDPEEKRRAERLFEQVNKEGQSLRDLAKLCEDDQWRLGVSVIIIKHNYYRATGDSVFYSEGEVFRREVDELVRADPKRVVPMVDDRGRVGGSWACPFHRETAHDDPGICEECGAELQEVYFGERDGTRGDDARTHYFEHEVVTWAYPFPRLNGLDGLAPVSHIWVKQAILEFMDTYAGAFYDPESDRLPNQIMVLHTTNPDKWEDELKRAREDAKDDPYDSPIFTNEYSAQSNSTPEVQVLDVMPDELLGQNGEMKSDFKSDIRQAIGITDVYDSDLEEAGGLNNEGLQMEVTDRSIASQQHDYIVGWLDTLAKRLDIDDWRIEFIPSSGPDIDQLRDNIKTGAMADKAGLDARIEDGETQVADGEFDVQDAEMGQAPGATGGQGIGGLVGDDSKPDDGDETTDDAPAVQQNADMSPQHDLDLLQDAYAHIVWADDVDQKAAPFFDEDDTIPEFVTDLVQEALNRGALYGDIEDLSAGDRARLVNFFSEKLTQRQGWSLDSLATDIADRFGVDHQQAESIARNEAGNVLKKAREVGYERQDLADEAEFKWVGPADDDKHQACWWLLEKTNPRFGGDPVSLSEMKALVQEANDRFDIDHEAREWSPHIGCRDAYVQHYGGSS